MTVPTVVYFSSDESPNDICDKLGIETVREQGQPVRWHYKGITVYRPEHVQNFEAALLEHFNIQVVYQAKNQLSMF